MKKDKIIELLRLFYTEPKSNDQNNNDQFKRKLYRTIPPDFTDTRLSFFKKNKIELSFGFGAFALILLFISIYFLSVSIGSDPFKPTKIIKIDQSDLMSDSFKPTKIVEISDKDRIN